MKKYGSNWKSLEIYNSRMIRKTVEAAFIGSRIQLLTVILYRYAILTHMLDKLIVSRIIDPFPKIFGAVGSIYPYLRKVPLSFHSTKHHTSTPVPSNSKFLYFLENCISFQFGLKQVTDQSSAK